MKNVKNLSKNNLMLYIILWFIYLLASSIIIIADIRGFFLSIIVFPFNIIILYLVVQAYEFKRAARYIKEYHISHWKDIKAHAIGYTIKPSWYNDSSSNYDDPMIDIIKKNLSQLIYFRVIIGIHILLVFTMYTIY